MSISAHTILEKLIDTLRNAGVSPIPDSKFLVERISARMQGIQSLPTKNGVDKISQLSDYTSPICFANSAEVQMDYKSDDILMKQIDEFIDQLILNPDS